MHEFPIAVEVFHNTPTCIYKVADVAITGNDLTAEHACEFAKFHTISIGEDWWDNIEVIPSKSVKDAGGARSTSVGDYMKVIWMEHEPTFHRITKFGLERIDVTDEDELQAYSNN